MGSECFIRLSLQRFSETRDYITSSAKCVGRQRTMPCHLSWRSLCTCDRLALKQGGASCVCAQPCTAMATVEKKMRENLPPPSRALDRVTASSLPSTFSPCSHWKTALIKPPTHAFTCTRSIQGAGHDRISLHLDFIQNMMLLWFGSRYWSCGARFERCVCKQPHVIQPLDHLHLQKFIFIASVLLCCGSEISLY